MESSHSVETNKGNNLTKSTKAEESTEQSDILISQNNTTFSVKPENEKTLLDTALEQGHSLQYKCKKGTCGRCNVHILQGKERLSSPNEQEKSKLKTSLEDGYRLACQALFIS